MKIGIPRALYYYEYYSFWKTFFETLGFEVVLSRKTNKQIMDWGLSFAVDSTCLPVKIYYGHVYDLASQEVDYIFIPRIISVAKGEYICPKFMGLPDMIRNNVPDLPKILSPIIDARKGSKQILKAYLGLGTQFTPALKALQAYYKGIRKQRLHENLAKQEPNEQNGLTIGILGHEYIIYDDFLTLGILERLQASGHKIIAMDSLDTTLVIEHSVAWSKRMFWTSGRKIIGSANYLTGRVDGLISITAFSCGTDSLVGDLVERLSSRNQVPHLTLSLDEHTGEAGMITRIEAFLDMLERRKTSEANCATHGELLHSL